MPSPTLGRVGTIVSLRRPHRVSKADRIRAKRRAVSSTRCTSHRQDQGHSLQAGFVSDPPPTRLAIRAAQ